MAKAAPTAVIFYRRSHRTTYCLALDYARRGKGFRDRLSRGSRFYGRIFPERCDLSPDGSLLVYFAMRGKLTDGRADPSTWTALCTPPWLKAHLFFPNGSTWGGGGLFFRDHRLLVIDTPPKDAGKEYEKFRGYTLLRNRASLSDSEAALLNERFRPPAVAHLPCPTGPSRKQRLALVRSARSGRDSAYERFDYVLQDEAGKDVEGAEDIVLANWAGWDIFGRLWVAAGRYLKIYEVKPGRRLPQPTRTLDLEAAVQSGNIA